MTDTKRTIGETASLFNVTPRTINNWCSVCAEQLEPDATRRTGKRFSESDIQLFRKLVHLLSEGFTYEQARERLPVTPEVLEMPSEGVQNAPEQPETGSVSIMTLEFMEHLQNLLNVQNEQYQATVQAKQEHIETLKAENERLREENERLKRPFWKRLFS